MTVQFAKATGRFRTFITDGVDPDETPDIVNLSGKVTLTPNVTHLIDSSDPDGGLFGASPFIAEVRDGILSTPGQPYGYLWFLATQNPDMNPPSWAYTVTYDLATADGRKIAIPSVTMTAAPGDVVNLSRLVPAASSPVVGVAVAEAAALRAEAALAKSVRSLNGNLPDENGNVNLVATARAGGWTTASLSAAVAASLARADSAYQLPTGGVPSADMTAAVRASLLKADGSVPTGAAAAGQIYYNNAGTATGVPFTTAPTAATVAQRDANGGLRVAATPTLTDHSTSKSYVDGQIATRIQKGAAAIVYADLDPTMATAINNGASAYAGMSGKADLVGGLIPTNQLPSLAINDIFTVASQAAMLALNAQRGDIAIRSDTNRTYILSADAPGTLANWVVLPDANSVTSVNGQQGVIVLAAGDVGAVPTTRQVNGKALSADVTIAAADVGAAPTSHTHTMAQISDASAVGRSVFGAADQATARNALAAAAWGISISAGTGLTGGGDLTTNRTIGLSTATQTSLGKADTAMQAPTAIKSVQQITAAAYAALATKDASVLYAVVG